MSIRIWILFFLLPVMVSCRGDWKKKIKGNGITARETRSVSSFEEVTLKGPVDVVLREGEECRVEVEADENILSYITTRVSGNELKVGLKNSIRLFTGNKMVVYVTAPRFSKCTISGSGNISTEGIINNPSSIQFITAGSGDVNADINTPSLSCSIAGSGNITLKGQTREQTINIAGNGDINNDNLLSENTTVKIAGSGNARIHASVQLKVEIVGSGDIFYRGNPAITQKVMGSGEVRKLP